MDYSMDCPDDILIEIFKNLDLKTRLQAGQTCQRWNRLLKDPLAFLEDVSISRIEESDVNILTSTLIHIGKAKELWLHGSNLATSPVSQTIQDGRFKIDTLFLVCSSELAESECVNQLLPTSIDEDGKLLSSSITKLYLSCGWLRGLILRSDWSRFSNLEYFKLDNLFIDTSSKPPPKLKRLDLNVDQDDVEEKILFFIFALNTTILYVPTLEELRLISFRALEKETFERFLSVINRLPKLRRLCFEKCSYFFDGSGAPTMNNLIFDYLKEIKFVDCSFYDSDVAQIFLRHYTLDMMKIETIITVDDRVFGSINTSEGIEEIYNLAISAKERKTEFGLNLRFEGNTSTIWENFSVPVEVGQTLAKLSLRDVSSLEFLQRHFDCFTYEKLTKIKLIRCKMNDDILKRIARLCPFLEKLRICDCQEITENALKSFLIYWEERKSRQLSIECADTITIIGGLFRFFFKDGNGILDDAWMKEDEENGEPLSRRQKKSDEKRFL